MCKVNDEVMCVPGVRVAGHDDVGADVPGRAHGGVGGGARHGDAPLPHAPAGQAHVHQPRRLHLRLDARPAAPRQARRYARTRAVRTRARRCKSY